jgi:predicted Zn-dependent protease
MRLRVLRLLPVTLCVGCAVLAGRSVEDLSTAAVNDSGVTQVSAEGTPAAQDPRQLLQIAATHLQKGENAAALPYLTRYVEENPGHIAIRVHLAELLLKLDKPGEAREHLERYINDAQNQGDLVSQHMAHSFIRLMEIAQKQGDEYAEHLNRGIGLYCVAEQMLANPESTDEPSAQKSLFKAIEELKYAAKLRSDEPRPYWYLHEAWSSLGQSLPARQSLHRAQKRAVLGGLTPAEEQALAMAVQDDLAVR